MKVLPNAKVQTLSECEPSQLVRSLEYRGNGRLGVVSDMTDDRTARDCIPGGRTSLF